MKSASDHEEKQVEQQSQLVHGRARTVRWFISYGLIAAPQSAAPIAFALVALLLTGSAENGAQMVLAMMLAQVLLATPITRFGGRFHAVTYLRALLLIRTVAFVLIGLLATSSTPFGFLVAAAAVAGSINGAAYGIQRAILNELVPARKLARALGIAATVYEVTFVLSPMISSATGAISPFLAIWALAVLGAAPILVVPRVNSTTPAPPEGARSSVLTWPVIMWLFCTCGMTSVAAGIEVSAVSIAISHGLEPSMGYIFAGTLCLASAVGGVWVSIRNRMPHRSTVLIYHLVCFSGATLVAFGANLATTLIGTAMAGLVLAPLSTFYSLVLDQLAPPHRRSEVFALMRTSNAISFIVVSGLLAWTTLEVTLFFDAAIILASGLLIATVTVAGRRRRRTV